MKSSKHFTLTGLMTSVKQHLKKCVGTCVLHNQSPMSWEKSTILWEDTPSTLSRNFCKKGALFQC